MGTFTFDIINLLRKHSLQNASEIFWLFRSADQMNNTLMLNVLIINVLEGFILVVAMNMYYNF